MNINLNDSFPNYWKRLTKFIVSTCVFMCATTLFSSSPKEMFPLKEEIKITSDQAMTVIQVFDFIQEQLDYNFIYSDDLIVNAPEILLKKGVIPVEKLLDKGLSPINCTYEITDNNTIEIIRKSDLGNTPSTIQLNINGTIFDSMGNIMPGVNILEKGTSNGTQSDFDGNFTITVSSENPILLISYVGFKSQEVSVTEGEEIRVVLQEESAQLDEVVVTALGIKKEKKALGYSVQEVTGGTVRNSNELNVINSLAGRVAGVQINAASSGADGSSNIIIKGQNFSSNANQAIDGDIASNYEFSSVEIDQGFVIDLGEVYELKSFTYTPDQSRWPSGIITHYDCYLSTNGKTWRLAVNGEFSNIINNPVKQNVRFSEIIKARFIKLKVKKTREGDQKPIIAEFGVVTN